MSTILKALRRLERERSKDAERPLREEVVFARPRRRGPSGSWALVGGALALGFAVTWWLLPRSSPDVGNVSPIPAAATATPAPRAASPPVAARGAMVATPAPTTPAELPASAPSFAISAPAVEPSASAVGGSIAAASEPTRPTPGRAVRVESVETAEVDPVPVVPIEGRASRLVDEEPAARRTRAEVPVRVVRTSWHPRAERRAAWVAVGGADPREVREGEWVGALEIRTIEPDGILFADGPLLVHRSIGER